MSRLAIFALAGLALSPAPAFAEEWDGVVFGPSVSLDRTESGNTIGATADLAFPFAPQPVAKPESEGISLGGLAGYRRDVGGVVIGAEIDAFVNLGAGETQTLPFYLLQPQWHGSVRGIAGVPLGRLLIFGTAGMAIRKYAHTDPPAGPWPLTPRAEAPEALVAGGGFELAAGRWHPRIEYRHIRTGTTIVDVSTSPFTDRNQTHSVQLSILHRF